MSNRDSIARAAQHQGTLLAIGCGLLLVSNGRWILPIATWLAPIPWLLFVERAGHRATFGAAVLYAAVLFVSWQGLIPAPGAIYLAIILAYAAAYFVPYLVHRVLARHHVGLLWTLVFPVASVAVEFLFQRFATPYGSWFSVAYTQVTDLALLQVVSLVGTWGVTFLIAWGAAVAAYFARRALMDDSLRATTREMGRHSWTTPRFRGSRTPIIAFAVAMLATCGYGELRIWPTQNSAPLVRVAALVPTPRLAQDVDRYFSPRLTPSAPTWDSLRAAAAVLNADLFERSRREAQSGARIIAWSETAARLLKQDEPDFLARASALAVSERVQLFVAYGTFTPGNPHPLENAVAAIDSTGRLAWVFHKAHPIVGPESPLVASGDAKLRTLLLPLGRVSAAICHDMDFPTLIRQAGLRDVTLLVNPAADWPDITEMHSNMARVRAIENGFTMVRPASGGRSLVTSDRGETLAQLDSPTDALVAIVRPRAVATLYAQIGDAFAWACVLLLIVASALALQRPGTGAPTV